MQKEVITLTPEQQTEHGISEIKKAIRKEKKSK